MRCQLAERPGGSAPAGGAPRQEERRQREEQPRREEPRRERPRGSRQREEPQRGRQPGSAAGQRQLLFEIPLDYVGGEVAAVAELDALPDGEGDRLLIVRHLVRLGEPGNQIAFLV